MDGGKLACDFRRALSGNGIEIICISAQVSSTDAMTAAIFTNVRVRAAVYAAQPIALSRAWLQNAIEGRIAQEIVLALALAQAVLIETAAWARIKIIFHRLTLACVVVPLRLVDARLTF